MRMIKVKATVIFQPNKFLQAWKFEILNHELSSI